MDALHSDHRRFALLIDAENVPATSIEAVMNELAN
jgi:hypothetical protein